MKKTMKKTCMNKKKFQRLQKFQMLQTLQRLQRLGSVVLTFGLVISLGLACLSADAFASRKDDTLPVPALSGNRQNDMLTVARSQLGYAEDENGETYYAEWAGGMATDQWCSEFASWCAFRAGVPESVIPKCTGGGDWLKFFGRLGSLYLLDGGQGDKGLALDYAKNPDGSVRRLSLDQVKKGDIVLVETDDYPANGPDHTTIVKKVENGKIITYEGNMFNMVTEYTRMPSEVHAVCRPAYTKTAQDLADIADIRIYSSIWNYTGAKIKPTVSVRNPLITLEEGKDYTISYENNVNTGTAYVVAKGKGIYTGTIKAPFTIKPTSIARPYCTKTNPTYDGTGHTVSVTMTLQLADGSTYTLKEGVDYTLTGNAATDAGDYKMTIKGKGNYEGVRTVSYTVKQQSQDSLFTGLTMSTASTSMKVGASQKVQITGTYMGGIHYESDDPDIAVVDDQGNVTAMSPGSAIIRVTADGIVAGKANYAPRTRTKTINVSVNAANYTVGSTVAPACDRRGYTNYISNKSGFPDYKGDFVDALGHQKGTLISSRKVSCTEDGIELRHCPRCDRDYEKVIQESPGHVAGNPVLNTLVASTYDERGAGSQDSYCIYCDQLMDSEMVTLPLLDKIALSECTIKLPAASYAFCGERIEPEVKLYHGTDLIDERNYYATYHYCKLVGTASVKIYPREDVNNCCLKGSVSKEYQITPASISGYSIDLQSSDPVTYKGSPRTPSIYVHDKKGKRIHHDYFDVTYTNNLNVGTAEIKVVGKNLYKGTIKSTFKIVKGKQKLTISQKEYSKVIGNADFKLGVTTDGDGKIKYVSSHPEIVSVTSAGKVSLLKTGTAKITVYAAAGANCNKSAESTIKIQVAPKVPALTKIENTTSNTLRVFWKKPTGRVNGYIVYRKAPGESKFTMLDYAGNNLYFTDKTAKLGKTYSYKVQAYYKNSVGEYSYLAKSKLSSAQSMYCIARPVLKDIVKNTSNLKVAWSKVANAGGYEVYRSTDGGKTFARVKKTGADTLSYKDTDVKKGKQYKYTVKAIKKASDGSIYKSADASTKSRTF